jgi:two-component system sensor histidine kinase KdpD
VVLVDDDGLRIEGRAGVEALSDADLEAARWSLAANLPTRGGAWPGAEAAFDFWPIVTARRRRAVIGVRIAGPEGRPEAPERRVEIVAGYLAVALEREALARQALDHEVLVAGERFKADLLAAVSHDLRTPLATILLSLQSLRALEGGHDAATRATLLEATEAEAARLARMVENLLDMNRLEAGALPVKPQPTPPARLVAAALQRAAPALAGRRIVNQARRGHAMLVDPGLFESALANLLENAGKYSPEGSTVRIRAGRDEDEDGMGFIEVLDEGPGFAGAAAPYFEKFARGQAGDGRAPGTGLGLSIARGFLEAQGGRVEASDRSDSAGARVRLLAPLAAGAA